MSAEACRIKSKDGLAEGTASFVELYDKVVQDQRFNNGQWCAHLLTQDVRIAHPDDGWVDRKVNKLSPCYPQLRQLEINVGSLAVLGWPDKYRYVRITKVEPDPWGISRNSPSRQDRYFFEYLHPGIHFVFNAVDKPFIKRWNKNPYDDCWIPVTGLVMSTGQVHELNRIEEFLIKFKFFKLEWLERIYLKKFF